MKLCYLKFCRKLTWWTSAHCTCSLQKFPATARYMFVTCKREIESINSNCENLFDCLIIASIGNMFSLISLFLTLFDN